MTMELETDRLLGGDKCALCGEDHHEAPETGPKDDVLDHPVVLDALYHLTTLLGEPTEEQQSEIGRVLSVFVTAVQKVSEGRTVRLTLHALFGKGAGRYLVDVLSTGATDAHIHVHFEGPERPGGRVN